MNVRKWQGLSIETSGHIFRIFGSQAMREDLASLIARFEKAGTTAFTCREFENVVGGLYNTIRKAMVKLPHPDKGRTFKELKDLAVFELPPFIKGGAKLLTPVLSQLEERFHGTTPSPRQVANECRGQREAAMILLYQDRSRALIVHDVSTCCLWDKKELCDDGPSSGACKLAGFMRRGQAEFLSGLEAVGQSDVTEAAWIRSNLERLRGLTGDDLLREITRNPNNLGDTIIFCETPENWDILTRDRAFIVLQQSRQIARQIFMVRAPRFPAAEQCTVALPDDMTPRSGKLVNASATGAMLVMKEPLEVDTSLALTAKETFLETRNGFVVGVEGAGRDWHVRVSFKTRKRKPPGRVAAPPAIQGNRDSNPRN